jgi:DNA excision repair protein ERCC-4
MTMKQTIHIIMDDRELSGAVSDALSAMPDVDLCIERLPVGDYLVGDRLLVERKTLNDFALSVIDGRLFRQMTRLAASRYSVALILEGSGRDLKRTGIRREALQGALIVVCLVLGVPPVGVGSAAAIAFRQRRGGL